MKNTKPGGGAGPQIMCDSCGHYMPLALACRCGGAVSITCPDCASRELLCGHEGIESLRRERRRLLVSA